ncbi:hypothetical protein HETIRDRAFT_324956 [Heterobasidion irregulare TC 32-1]|uniref:Uncharacterized protein n=1 Tax=Heterobasidion irregulare (strain TC 32-1) TaxID=747525 RepID=W4JY39_HETIT|nr:uncharacterized protein HETIRDRAFT_324956 [Heterobasidion irregulare TC 32-1]ETW78364.1 hypothetical protein HETIRDRAFT_324956 [Heterobasidion irregulare TC 32-1]
MDPWRVSDSASWRSRPLMHYSIPAPARAIVRSGERYDPTSACNDTRNGWPSEMSMHPLCRIDSMVETNAAPGVQLAPGRLAEVRTVQRNTNIYNDEHNGNHLPVEHTFAEAISVPIAGPVASPPCPAAFTLKKLMVSSARARTKTRNPTRELHDARPHICTKHRTVYRHHGDLVRHKRTTPGHTAYQGPVTCVCRREYSRQDGMYKHLKTKKCTGLPRSWA